MRPDAWINELGPGGLDHDLKPRASARSRFGDFRAFEAEVLPAGSAQLPMLSLSRFAANNGLAVPRRGPEAVASDACAGVICPGAFSSQYRPSHQTLF